MVKEYVNVRIEKKLYEKIKNAKIPNYLYFSQNEKDRVTLSWYYDDKVSRKIENVLEFSLENWELYFKSFYFKTLLRSDNIESILKCQHKILLTCNDCYTSYCKFCESWQHEFRTFEKCLLSIRLEKHKYRDYPIFITYRMYTV